MVRLVHPVPRSPSCNMEPQINSIKVKAHKAAHVPWNREQIAEVFRSVSTNGELSKEELKMGFEKLGSRCTAYRVWRALRYADANRDKIISKEEFKNVVDYAYECGYKL